MKKIIVIILCAVLILGGIVTCIKVKEARKTKQYLAILVSNRDCSIDVIKEIAIDNGYDSYDDMCQSLVKKGYLVYVPSFTHEGHTYEARYTCKGTIFYHLALELGVI